MSGPPVLLRPVGFWTTREGDGLPDPRALRSPTWERSRRGLIAAYLSGAAVLDGDQERHECLICGIAAGSKERTDGAWRWPEGLAHYVVEHGVKLPLELVQKMERLEFQAPAVDVKALQAQLAPKDPTATGLMSRADAAAALLDSMLSSAPRRRQAGAAGARRGPARRRAAGALDPLDESTAAIPVARPWRVTVHGVRTPTPSVVFDRPIVLGRDRTCDLVLEHRSVSRRHVRLVPVDDRVIVQDLGSANGVHVGGRRHDGQIEIQEGEQVALGQATITLVRAGNER